MSFDWQGIHERIHTKNRRQRVPLQWKWRNYSDGIAIIVPGPPGTLGDGVQCVTIKLSKSRRAVKVVDTFCDSVQIMQRTQTQSRRGYGGTTCKIIQPQILESGFGRWPRGKYLGVERIDADSESE